MGKSQRSYEPGTENDTFLGKIIILSRHAPPEASTSGWRPDQAHTNQGEVAEPGGKEGYGLRGESAIGADAG
jgi:hypothetical protein